MARFSFRRAPEATPQQLIATGAAGGYGTDPVDGDVGYRQVGVGRREQPQWNTEKARAYSVAAYRSNPMARAIIDTYTSFAVGDSGVTPQCHCPEVYEVLLAWWNDPRQRMGLLQESLMRDHMLMGESVFEYMVGPTTGVTRFSPIDPARVMGVALDSGNPLWPKSLHLFNPETDANDLVLDIAGVDDLTGLRTGQVGFFPSWRALVTDRRGAPFLSPVLDQLDMYDAVLSNLVDRTALARYLVWDVTISGNGGQTDVDNFIKARGGMHVPRSGSIEVHNESVKWDAKTAQTGSFEDTNTLTSVLTNIAGGTGLAKTWLAEPAGANRATSLTMAEPVRRRVGGVQNLWLDIMTEMARYVIDQAVTVGRLPRMVTSTNAMGVMTEMPAADTVRIVGPEIAAADAQITAAVLLNLSTALTGFVDSGVMSPDAAAAAAQKGWEQFMGQPFRADLAIDPSVNADDLASEVESANARLRLAI